MFTRSYRLKEGNWGMTAKEIADHLGLSNPKNSTTYTTAGTSLVLGMRPIGKFSRDFKGFTLAVGNRDDLHKKATEIATEKKRFRII